MAVTTEIIHPVIRNVIRRSNRTTYYDPWLPSRLSDLAAWYDANDLRTITESSGSVSQWDDKSGGGHHLVQGSGSLQPTTGSVTIGGLNALEFDGVNDYLQVATPALTQPFTRIFVYNASVSSSIYHLMNSGGVENTAEYVTLTNEIAQFASLTANNLAVVNDTNYIRVSEYDGASSSVYRDGTLTGPANAGASNSTGLTVGAFYDGSLATDVNFGEVILVDGILSTADRQNVEGYLAHKWGLTASLPSGHPYKTSAPTT